MKAHSRSRTMRLVILLYQLGLIFRTEAQSSKCTLEPHRTYRAPRNSDIRVDCGTEYMDISIYLCPMYFALYNESLMALNGNYKSQSCLGTADWDADPPLLNFTFPITQSGITTCGNIMRISDSYGSGMFSDFSNMQHVNISGVVSAYDPSAGTITYREHLLYMYSCKYPMLYLVNNTQLGVSGVNLAVNDNNGSFISTLSMRLYEDPGYSLPLVVPPSGLNLKTKIYVGIHAQNLTDRFNVLLDRCYATTSPLPSNSTYYDLFVGCDKDDQTKVEVNGEAQHAHFSFEAFRFVEHKNMSISTFYLHCITRLCAVDKCAELKPNCGAPTLAPAPVRRRRDVSRQEDNTAILNSPPIGVNNNNNNVPDSSPRTPTGSSVRVGPTISVAVAVVLASAIASLGL